ncbi:MAG: sigma-70 family RNA polymerase sigma factor [Candidatus Eremiobacterota bacterium]
MSDEELMAGVQEGRFEHLDLLVERYQRPLFGYSVRVLHQSHAAEDAVQEVFLRVFRCRAQYRRGAPFKAWVYQICLNVCRDALRRSKRRPADPLDDLPLADPAPGPEQQTVLAHRIQTAIARLPDKLREVFMLVHYQGLLYQEVAQVLGIPMGTVKSRMFHATSKLAEDLKDLR